ncbi:14427_t:CDS:2 [Cetraspora pellucida]|uniref:14427_t:CDS:1 n=1 Tax=Cetraspora pellucida TaxID=1433469 RepID=A0A9N9CSE4_9GLOM|nr:14427_t:CDS:2 [Cetraspora pellucida]
MWTDDQLRLLIDERKNRNADYYNISGNSRVNFWNSIANTINERFGTTYTGHQCNNRFQNLVRDYNLGAKLERGAEQMNDILKNLILIFRRDLNIETPFDILHNANTSTKRCRCNRTPLLTYEVSSILSTSCHESTTNQRNRSALPIWRVPSRRDENSNRDNVNSAVGHSLANVNDVCGDSGNNTNDASRNLSNVTYSSSSELINITSALNLFASQNDSDLSMPDIGRPLESINEES